MGKSGTAILLQRIAANGPLGDLKINIVTQQGISYCPFCGIQLDQLDVAEIAELESLHSRFICS